jgi:histidinol dehydrogenase
MIRIYETSSASYEEILNAKTRYRNEGINQTVRAILEDVRKNKDNAVLKYTEKFDGVKLNGLKVTDAEIDDAFARSDPAFRDILLRARDNITAFHSRQRSDDFILSEKAGVVLGQRTTPIEKAGVYVPGGTASYPSTVLMNILPAKNAGVSEIVMVSPPDKNGMVPDAILCAAKIAGADSVYKCGGAQAIAALAYGTQSIPKVDKIVGPGNVYVAAAKKAVFGAVDIEYDRRAERNPRTGQRRWDARCIAADMLSQAEHDALASAVLICTSAELAMRVAEQIELQLSRLNRKKIARKSIEDNGKIIVAKDISEAVDLVNMFAPEHLEICLDDPFSIFGRIKHAGSIFLGKNVPEALGDYYAGPNHTLTTSGAARFSSPLSVYDFVKRSSFIYYTKEALAAVKDDVIAFAQTEGLDAHARSIGVRFEAEDVQ